jgi:hypothetical protein
MARHSSYGKQVWLTKRDLFAPKRVLVEQSHLSHTPLWYKDALAGGSGKVDLLVENSPLRGPPGKPEMCEFQVRTEGTTYGSDARLFGRSEISFPTLPLPCAPLNLNSARSSETFSRVCSHLSPPLCRSRLPFRTRGGRF